MAVKVDIEVAAGAAGGEFDIRVAVVRITIFEVHVGVRVDGIFNACTCAPAVQLEVAIGFDRAIVAEDVQLGIGVTALCVQQGIGCNLGTDARADVEIAASVDFTQPKISITTINSP